jgi:hypothetical protein
MQIAFIHICSLFIGGDFRRMPATSGSLEQHIRRAALSTAIQKSAHIALPNIPPPAQLTDFGWQQTEAGLKPIASTNPAWPDDLPSQLMCHCKKGCSGNRCGCTKRNTRCCTACDCGAVVGKCSNIDFSED